MINNLKQVLADRVNQRIDSMDAWVHKKEFQALPNILVTGEKVTAVAEGTHQGKQGMIFTTDRRFLFVRKPMLGPARHTAFAYQHVSNIQIDRYTATAVITLDMPEGRHTLDHITLMQIDELIKGLSHSELAKQLN